MSFISSPRVFAAVLTNALCIAGAAYPQGIPASSDPPEAVPLRLGPVTLAPAVTLTNFGWDSNVFQQQVAADPVGDVTATVTPDIRSWIRLGRARVSTQQHIRLLLFSTV